MSDSRRFGVLVVDDDGDLRLLVRSLLDTHPQLYVVAEAEDGATALRLAAECRPDVVILDLGLPDITGHDVVTALRATDPNVRVVIYTGNEPVSRSAVMALGAAGLVLKGEALARLLHVVEDVARTAEAVASIDLPEDTASTSRARRFVGDHLDRWARADLYDDVCLIVTELVSNAVIHARSESRVVLRLGDGVLRIEVTDQGPGTPEPQPASATRPNGRGLMLISAIATAWGIDPATGGKQVWVEVAA